MYAYALHEWPIKREAKLEDVRGLVRMGSPYFFESIVATSAARIARNADEARVTMHLPLGSAGCRVARASRVLVLASRQNGLFQLCLS